MKSRLKIIDRILTAIETSQCLCVAGHVRPDGDCIGSQLALTLALQEQGKQVRCWNADAVPNKLTFLDPEGLITIPKAGQVFDCVIALDSASLDRLGPVVDCIQNRQRFINIDHHHSNTRYADINWVSGDQPSTGELVFQLLKTAKWPITPRIANCLFTAISTDTGSFQYPSTRPSTYAAAGELVERGANLADICNEVYQSYPLSRVRLMKQILNHFHLTDQNQIAYYWLRPADFTHSGASPSDSEGLIDHIRAIEPVIVACQFEEVEPNHIRISLRSKSPKIDVNAVALQFNGGGHKSASGATIEGSSLSVQRRVLKAIRKALNTAD